jgi:signal transduction histidine kinase
MVPQRLFRRSELLNLINDILDLSKIESGTVTVEAEETSFISLRDTIERNFRHVAEAKNLPFHLELDASLPRTLTTDPKRLQQIIKNLLSNAFKFTHHGEVMMRISLATAGWSQAHPVLSRSPQVLALIVSDTGIGIAPDKQKLVFEAFQQADASTSRKYGGTGLGLAISRELATLLGGEIKLVSTLGEGSTFTLYLPVHYTGPSTAWVGFALVGRRPINPRPTGSAQAAGRRDPG